MKQLFLWFLASGWFPGWRVAQRCGLVVSGALLVLIQGQAAELPQVLTGINARFDGAQLPVVTGNNMVVNQFADKATLHWQSFNIGAGGQVEFKQPSASAVALNRIFDAAPSEVNGRLTANGQVYLINQNGIVFGPDAQVNTQSLVASTLDIDDQVYREIGFVNAINAPEGALPAFDSFGRPMGEIRIAEGAQLESAKNGRILVFAPTIVNEGTISTPEGQQVLAAVKDRVLIAASDDPDLRGLLVEVSTGGDVTNLGTLIAERGNITLLGMAVNQDGVARATTSVSLNGSVRLLAQDMNGTLALANDLVPRRPKSVRGGELRLGSDSVTEVVPDTTPDKDGAEILAVDAQSQPLSQIDLAGTDVRLESRARVTSTAGAINLTAAANPGQPDLLLPGDPQSVSARLVVEEGAIVDASGDRSTVVSVARNVVDVEARGNELADSPVQRDGPLRNETLQVDIRRGTDFLNIDGAVASIGRSAGERQSVGGTITIRTEGSFLLEDGARLDVSGGQVTYTEGLVSTSRLQQANGTVVDISSADPSVSYLRRVDNVVSREAGYVEGKDGGTLNLQARGFELLGEIRAGTTSGVNQRRAPADLPASLPAFARPYDQVPLAGALGLTLLRSGLPGLVLGEAMAPVPGVPPLVLSAELIRASGAGRIGLVNAGPVIVNGPLQLAPWAELSLTGTQVRVPGDLRIAGGRVGLNASNDLVGALVVADQDLLVRIDGAVDLSGTWVNDNPILNRTRSTAPIVLDGGRLTIDSGSSIEVTSTSHLDVSAGAYRTASGNFIGGRGGSMTFSTGSVEVNPAFGSRLTLGGELRAFGFSGGGSLRIETERMRIVPEAGTIDDQDVRLDANRQFSLRETGDTQGNRQYFLDIGAGTFQQGGFASYRLTSTRADLEVAALADVVLRTAGYLPAATALSLVATGADVDALATPVLAPDFSRRPAELVLSTNEKLANAIGPVADLRIAAGAIIRADARSTIGLRSTTSMFVDGGIDAPAGLIDLQLGGGPGIFQPDQMIWLGAESLLTASGTALVDTLNPLGLRLGEVLDAGRVTVRANQGSVVGAAGARIAVDGTSAMLDIGFGVPVRTAVAGAAGAIELRAAESLLYQGLLSGAAPASFPAPGGWLTVAIDPTDRGVPPLIGVDQIPRGPHRLVVQDFTGTVPEPGDAIDAQFYSTGFVPLGALRSGGFAGLELRVRSSAAGTDGSGAPVPDTPDSMPVIEFPEDLELGLAAALRLDAAILRTDAAQVTLSAPYVGIGFADTRVRLDGALPSRSSASNPQPPGTPIRLTPGSGDGLLRVEGELIELVGESVTEGFGDAAAGRDGVVIAASGDVRLRGVRKALQSDYAGLFRTAGNLQITAGRIYPTTLTAFEVGVEGDGGQLILGGAGGPVPLSVGGELTLCAAQIVQGGNLFAPLGTLSFEAGSSLQFTAGSLTSTSAAGLHAPFFRTEPGGALILPAPAAGEDQLVFVETVTNPEFERRLPEKRINLQAPAIELQPGSRFDLRGGSSVTATEFVPGPGGSTDILLADLDPGAGVVANGSFAILPAVGRFAPYDPLESPAAESAQGIRIGDTLVLEEGLSGLPAGEYAILPARYALYGGFLVTPEEGFRDLTPGKSLQRLDGAPILAGRFGVAGSGTADGRSQGFAIEDGTAVRRRAEYLQTALDDLYMHGVVRAPRDAGSLVIAAGDSLDLRAELVRGTVSGGLGSAVDIATAAALSVVNRLTGANGIELRALDLANLGADSLLLGGTRTAIEGGLRVDALSSAVTVQAGVELDVPELLLAAGRITVEASAEAATRLLSGRESSDQSTRILVNGDAALLALSDRRLRLDRNGSVAGSSSLALSGNASVEAGGSVVLDAAGNVDAAGAFKVRDGLLSLGAERILVGDAAGLATGSGLLLPGAILDGLAGNDLRLRSTGIIEVYGALLDGTSGAGANIGWLSIDAPGLRGFAEAGVSAALLAETIELANGSGVRVQPVAPGAAGSSLDLQAAGRFELGSGGFLIDGYANTSLAAGSALVLTGNGELNIGGALSVTAPVITAERTANSAIRAGGALIVAGADPTASGGAGLGASLSLTATDIDFAGRVVLPSGTVRLTQTAAVEPDAGLRLASGSVIDVAGATTQFGPRRVGTPGGTIVLSAQTGTLSIASASLLDVSAPVAGDREAGELQLLAPLGMVSLDAGAVLLGGDAVASSGRFRLDAGGLSGDGSDSRNALTTLAGLLGNGGFNDTRVIRLRQQDLALESGSAMNARHIRLAADTGAIEIAGTLDASGERPGSIFLAAGDSLVVSGALSARATADGAQGGRVDLYALDADGDDPDGAGEDVIHLRAGSVIDVSAGPGGSGGAVLLHTRRLDADGDGLSDQVVLGELAAEVTGASRAQLLATRVLRDPDATQVTDPVTGEPIARVTITAGQIEDWRSETEVFLSGLAQPMAGAFGIAAALQVESRGDLVLADRWDFMSGWHFDAPSGVATAPQAGVLTLRAARNTEILADLTDSFTEQLLFGFLPFDALTGGIAGYDDSGTAVELPPSSWGYRIAAGAELASADVLAVSARPADLRLGTGARIRTGTADIDIAASGDVRIGAGAAIYTAGWDRGLSAQLEAAAAAVTEPFGLTAYDFFGVFLNGGQFADGGGTLTISGGGQLIGATAPQPVTSWLTRVGSGQVTPVTLYSETEGFGAVPTHWGVAYNEFRNGVAAFGGGALRLALGGGVTNSVLATPTTGRSVSGVVADTSTGQLSFRPSQRETETLGGGELELRIGGSLAASQLVIGGGTARVRSGGDAATGSAPQIYLGGDARLDWIAGGGLRLGGVQDPTVAALDDSQLTLMSQIFSNIRTTADFDNRFYTYADQARISVGALGGDVTFAGTGFGAFLPPSLTAVALAGDVNVVATPLEFFPAPRSTLELLARDNVTGNFVGSVEARLRQADQERGLLPSVDRPDIRAVAPVPAAVPVHTGDTVPNLIVARDGSIQSSPGQAGFWTLQLAKPSLFLAGTDISNLSVKVQNIAADAVTSFQAGRDIVQRELRDNTGRFVANDARIFEIWGPGAAEFFAFRNISLGTSAGIESIGNAKNPALAADGASLLLLAGTGGEPAYERFAEVYLSAGPSAYRDKLNAVLAAIDTARAGFPSSSERQSLTIGAGEYAKALTEFLQEYGVAATDPVAAFLALDRSLQRKFLASVLFAEIKSWGAAAGTPDRADRLNYVRAYTALDTWFALTEPLAVRSDGFPAGALQQAIFDYLTLNDANAANAAQVQLFGALFPQGPRRGDISLLLSQVQTLAGGGLAMLAPGGDINAGAADAGIIDKKPADLGVVTARGGDIDIAVDNDLLVNSTRVFALQGDLLIWSSHGNIDAGKGAKTVTSVPDPITRIDPNTGDTIIEFPPAVSGSGLQGENAALFAPRGAVNAGDAGIRTSGDLTIGAVEVVGADNIDVGGVEIGFSTTDVTPVAPPGASSATSAATKALESQAAMLSEEDEAGDRTILGTQVTFISVEVLSFGSGKDCDPNREDCD